MMNTRYEPNRSEVLEAEIMADETLCSCGQPLYLHDDGFGACGDCPSFASPNVRRCRICRVELFPSGRGHALCGACQEER